MSNRVTISEEYREYLKFLTDPVELVVKDGRVVGVFGGVPEPHKRPNWMPAPPSHEELERMKGEPTYTTEEVLEHLRNRS